MLKQPVPSLSRWIAGSAVVVVLLLGAGVTAWAAQPSRVVSNDAAAVVAPALPAPPAPPAPPSTGLSAPGVAPPPPAPPAQPAPPRAAPRPAAAPPAPPKPMSSTSAPAPAAPSAASVDRMSAPAYPAEALASGVSGKVVMLIDIDAQGTAVAVEVEQSEPAGVFDRAAVDAAMKWMFSPELKDGKPVPGRVRVPIEFEASSTTQGSPRVAVELE